MRQRGALLFSVAALVVSLAGFGVICQNHYRVSLWMAEYERKRLDSDARLTASLEKIAARLTPPGVKK